MTHVCVNNLTITGSDKQLSINSVHVLTSRALLRLLVHVSLRVEQLLHSNPTGAAILWIDRLAIKQSRSELTYDISRDITIFRQPVLQRRLWTVWMDTGVLYSNFVDQKPLLFRWRGPHLCKLPERRRCICKFHVDLSQPSIVHQPVPSTFVSS